MNEAKEQIVDEISAAQLEKVRLEIESLKSKNKWEDRVARYIPLLTTLVAVVGFLFGIYQFQTQQKVQQERILSELQKDRTTQDVDQKQRLRSQVRSDIEQLLQFTTDRAQTLSRVSFLLNDLKSLLDQPVNENENEKVDNIFAQNSRTITETLVKLIHYDCDFIKNPRDVYFTSTIINHWPDYSTYLRQDINELKYFLYKYIRALRDLHQKNPSYFEKIEFDRSTSSYIVLVENENEEQQFQHYGEIVIGFKKHLELLGGQIDLMDEYIENFQNALCNPILTEQLYGKNFPSSCSRTSINTSLKSTKTDEVAPNIPIIVLNTVRGGSGGDNVIRLRPSIQRVVLTVALEGQLNYVRYRASILTYNRRLLWRANLQPDDDLYLSIGLSSSFLKAGNYILAIEGLTPEGDFRMNDSYPFRVIKSVR